MGKLEEALRQQPQQCSFERPQDWADQDLALAEAASLLRTNAVGPTSLWQRRSRTERTRRALVPDSVLVEDRLTEIGRGWPVWCVPDSDVPDVVVAFLRAAENDLTIACEASTSPGTHRVSTNHDRYTATVRLFVNGRESRDKGLARYLVEADSPPFGASHLSARCGVAEHRHPVYAPTVGHLIDRHLRYSVARLLERSTTDLSPLLHVTE